MNNTGDRAPASVAENVEKVIRVESETLQPRSRSEAVTETIGGFVGTISFVIAQLVAFALWIVVNAGTVPQLAPFDPFPYPLLSSITSLEAVLLAAFVLMKQNRMGMVADRRDHLDLQVNLLTEQRATQIIQMLDRLSTRLGVDQHHDETSRELARNVAVEHLVEELHSRLPGFMNPVGRGLISMRRRRSRRYSRLEPLQAGASDGSRGYASTPAHGVIASPLHLASIRLRSARDRGSGTLLGSKSPVRYPMDA